MQPAGGVKIGSNYMYLGVVSPYCLQYNMRQLLMNSTKPPLQPESTDSIYITDCNLLHQGVFAFNKALYTSISTVYQNQIKINENSIKNH